MRTTHVAEGEGALSVRVSCVETCAQFALSPAPATIIALLQSTSAVAQAQYLAVSSFAETRCFHWTNAVSSTESDLLVYEGSF